MIFKDKFSWEDKTVGQETFKPTGYKNFSYKKRDRKELWLKNIRIKNKHSQLKLWKLITKSAKNNKWVISWSLSISISFKLKIKSM